MLELVYDSRELKLKTLLESSKKENISLTEKYLDLGDIIFKKDGEDILIVERKTLSDLYSSIQDGRYKEQKIRLMGNYPIEKIVYIIEGHISQKNTKFFKNSKSITTGALLNMAFRDKLTVIRTENINDTCDILYSLGSKIIKNPEFFSVNVNNGNNVNNVNNVNTTDSISYLETIKVAKKDNMNPKLCNMLQLSQIPGVSKVMAQTIIEKYGSISNLIGEYKKIGLNDESCEKEQKEQKDMLKNIQLTNRKLGPIVSARIYDYLFY
jgi:ERCC4-type nuclease